MSSSMAAMQRCRRMFTPQQKATILRVHFRDKFPVSDPCDDYQIAPNLFYLRQKQALEHLTSALHDRRTQCGAAHTASTDRARIAELTATIAMKNRIITEVSEEYLDMKKGVGHHDGSLGAARSSRRRRALRHVAEYAHRTGGGADVAAPRLRARQVCALDGVN